jgi:putative transposase
MNQQHIQLKQNDQDFLISVLAKGQLPARVFKRATALLELHQGKTLSAVARTLHVTYFTVSRWRDSYNLDGLTFLQDKQRSGRPPLIDGSQRAKITALACSTPPEGQAAWSLRLLAGKVVELGFCDHLSHTHSQRILKKINSNRI